MGNEAEAVVRAVMSLYAGAKTRVRVGPRSFPRSFEVKVAVHQGSMLLPLVL